MIIIGYPGIGKTTLADWNNDYIDVDSSKFIFDGVRPSNWEYHYVKMAEDLSDQGYNVFVSSHEGVRKNIEFHVGAETPVLVVCPSLELKEQWVERLKHRWQEDLSHKNYMALKRAEEHYDEDITDLLNSPFRVIQICHMGYDLDELLENEMKDE